MENILEFLSDIGVILWIILGLSVLAIGIIIERLVYFRQITVNEEIVFAGIKEAIAKSRYEEAAALCDRTDSPLGALMKLGIRYRDQSEGVLRERLDEAARQKIPQLERYLTTLGTIAQISPLLGLLGTVTGNIQIFGVMGGGDLGNASLLSSGIAKALVTTAAGLIVAIPAMVFYNYLTKRVELLLIKMENHVSEVVSLLRLRYRRRGTTRL